MKLYQIDAFTAEPFRGNPAAVCLLDGPRPDAWMQAVAVEMNLSETAFLLPEGGDWRLRWFTPAMEVELCGHATLASAHFLWQTGLLAASAQARFHTRSGLLTADRRGDWIEMNFPARFIEPVQMMAGLGEALGLAPRFAGRWKEDYLLEANSEAELRRLAPNFSALKALNLRAVMVTCRAETPGYDFISRFFAPRMGVNEDPVTGSAHCALVPFWQSRLGKNEFSAYQASPRGGNLRLRLEDARVAIAGQAVTVLQGELI